MTNADKIRAMTDEELAEFLEDFKACDGCQYYRLPTGLCTFENLCTHGFAEAMIFEWLKSEAEPEGKV